MSRTIRGLLVTASAAVMAFAANAEQSVEERIAALEAMVAELKAELAAEKSDTDADIVRIETAAAQAAPAAAPKTDGFLVGDTTLKFGGFVDLDVHATSLSDGDITSTSIARDFYIPGSTPIGGEGTDFTDFTAESSRFFLAASKPVGDGKVEGYIEMDFLGSGQGNELVSNSYSPRLRRAYMKYGNWLAGQEWSTFQNTSAIPESASFL
ncbi:MAG TPA: DcaP family trimeric outer membrane transporter, partial [Hyphomonas sp.]|nr:DcaP family trimeric outer membrane transporter [Hyphomonas sp.]